jgi:hypothetical protein
VEQIILLKPESKWKAPEGCECIPCDDTLHLGASYNGKGFINPTPKPSQPVVDKVGQDGLTDSERATFKELAAKLVL